MLSNAGIDVGKQVCSRDYTISPVERSVKRFRWSFEETYPYVTAAVKDDPNYLALLNLSQIQLREPLARVHEVLRNVSKHGRE